MWWNVGPRLVRRMRAEPTWTAVETRPRELPPGNAEAVSGDLEEFRRALRRQFGSVTRAWRLHFDTDDSGLLDFHEFCSAATAIGYIGNLRTLWFNLGADRHGAVTLREFDADAAAALDKFRARSIERYGTISVMWTKLLDRDRSGQVSLNEFRAHISEIGYHDAVETEDLFHLLLARLGSTFLSFRDVAFLQGWHNTKAKQRRRLPPCWVNTDPFIHGPVDESWADPSARFLGPEAVDTARWQTDFKQALVRRFGSLAGAFDAMDVHRKGNLSMAEFVSVVVSALQYCRAGEARRLFLTFCEDPCGEITWCELGVSATDWENHKLQCQVRQLPARTAARKAGDAAPKGGALSRRAATRGRRAKDTVTFASLMPDDAGASAPAGPPARALARTGWFAKGR